MATDNTRFYYLSTWDIDQLVVTGTSAVGTGTTALYTFSAPLPTIPVFEVQLQVGNKWYQAGAFSTTGVLADIKNFFTYLSGNQLFINTTVSGNARYFIWSDRIDY